MLGFVILCNGKVIIIINNNYINYYLLLRFKNLFGRQKSGAPINWRKINEEEIKPRYT